MVAVGFGAGGLLTVGIDTQLIGLPLIKQADNVEVWFAGRAEFSQEHQRIDVSFRTARWNSQRPGDCTIKDSDITIRRDGRVQFAAKVKSKDDGDRYCVIIDLFDQRQVRLWHSSKICTPFDLRDQFASWINTDLSIPMVNYEAIAFATREDYC